MVDFQHTEPNNFMDERGARQVIAKIRDSDGTGQRLGGRFALTL